ncbi:hypothetical protein LXL04_007934 [Taraxacum kok-saghyz]
MDGKRRFWKQSNPSNLSSHRPAVFIPPTPNQIFLLLYLPSLLLQLVATEFGAFAHQPFDDMPQRGRVEELAPKVVTVVEQDLSHAGSFLGRFVDDPNRVSFNSDVDKSRRLMTRMADVAMNKDGVGCGEAIKVTWNLINQAWCYFKRKTKLAGIEARVHGNVILEKD